MVQRPRWHTHIKTLGECHPYGGVSNISLLKGFEHGSNTVWPIVMQWVMLDSGNFLFQFQENPKSLILIPPKYSIFPSNSDSSRKFLILSPTPGKYGFVESFRMISESELNLSIADCMCYTHGLQPCTVSFLWRARKMIGSIFFILKLTSAILQVVFLVHPIHGMY